MVDSWGASERYGPHLDLIHYQAEDSIMGRGYKPPRKIHKLVFEDMDGLIVRAKSVPIGTMLRIARCLKQVGDGDPEALDELFVAFSAALVDWNVVDDDDVPVPATFEGVCAQESDFIMQVVDGWMTAIAGVADPLDGSSTNGQPPHPLEGGLPMAIGPLGL